MEKLKQNLENLFSNFNLLLHPIYLQYQFSKMQQQQKLGNFISKLQYLLSNPEYSEIICWDKTETMIDVLSYEKMENEIIPLFFRHQKFQSFVRQLNLYGFKKVKANGKHRFTHSQLLKGEKLLSITSHKNSSGKKEEKELINEHLSHEKTSQSAGSSGKHEKNLPLISNSITQARNEVPQPTGTLPEAISYSINGYLDQRLQLAAYQQHYFNYWNMLMMNSSNQVGGYIFVNSIQNQQ